MKVLVFGAGVIGCYLTHVLCEAGHDVALLARGAWKDTLESPGLELRHHLHRKTTLDHPTITDHIDPEICWDAVFAAMPYHQMQKILPQLAQANTDLVVLIGNNMRAAAMQEELLQLSSSPKEILFAFQVTGGERLKDYAIVERFGKAGLDIGTLHSFPSEPAQKKPCSKAPAIKCAGSPTWKPFCSAIPPQSFPLPIWPMPAAGICGVPPGRSAGRCWTRLKKRLTG